MAEKRRSRRRGWIVGVAVAVGGAAAAVWFVRRRGGLVDHAELPTPVETVPGEVVTEVATAEVVDGGPAVAAAAVEAPATAGRHAAATPGEATMGAVSPAGAPRHATAEQNNSPAASTGSAPSDGTENDLFTPGRTADPATANGAAPPLR